jgi:HAD superfamily hydrolase (TIGR01549 family)
VTSSLSAALDLAPRGLLLDFGGVIFQTRKREEGRDAATARLLERLERAGYSVDRAALRSSLDAALTALGHWKHASSRRRTPREMTHREIVGDFIAADLDDGPRAVLMADAAEVLADLTTEMSEHTLRPGIPALLAEAARRGIPVGIVSNAHSGRSHRRLLADAGLADSFAVQVYSDEVGMRKPHPGMIELAARALGVAPGETWYVGDTMDRDVVAGRRAGVQAVVLTASKHTHNPPFAVDAHPDAIFDTPEGLAAALVASRADVGAAVANSTAHPNLTPQRPALLIDHGGVISTSVADAALREAFVTETAALLSRGGEPISARRVDEVLEIARRRHGDFKRAQHDRHERTGASIAEIDPVTFWRDFVGADLSPRHRAVLEAEAHDLMFRYGRAKSRRTVRPGIRSLFAACQERDMPIVVVSNTVSGRAVRAECREQSLDEAIAAFICSDEVGVRKPDPAIVEEALRAVGADPQRSWFYGDKPQNDAVAARAVGIAHRIIVRGGSTPDDALAAVSDGLITDIVDGAADLMALIAAAHPLPAAALAASA